MEASQGRGQAAGPQLALVAALTLLGLVLRRI
jgi:hypothetical protein